MVNKDMELARSRRIFLGESADYRQLCTISQSSSDSSIYFSAPKFGEIDWIAPRIEHGLEPIYSTFSAGDQGKLSLHGSGIAHVKCHESFKSNEFIIKGAILASEDGSTLGIRHLVTLILSEPIHKPSSPPGSRKTDYFIRAKRLLPYILVFWAIPRLGVNTVVVNSRFNVNEMAQVPPDMGWGGFGLINHGILWLAYRTKHMDRWPVTTQASYQDGYIVPLVIGTGEGQCRLEFRKPEYQYRNGNLVINLQT